MEKLTAIITVIGALAGLGIIGVIRKLIKEIKEAVSKYKEAKKDGKITEEEIQAIAKECMEAIEQGIKLGYLIKKAFNKKKK